MFSACLLKIYVPCMAKTLQTMFVPRLSYKLTGVVSTSNITIIISKNTSRNHFLDSMRIPILFFAVVIGKVCSWRRDKPGEEKPGRERWTGKSIFYFEKRQKILEILIEPMKSSIKIISKFWKVEVIRILLDNYEHFKGQNWLTDFTFRAFKRGRGNVWTWTGKAVTSAGDMQIETIS